MVSIFGYFQISYGYVDVDVYVHGLQYNAYYVVHSYPADHNNNSLERLNSILLLMS